MSNCVCVMTRILRLNNKTLAIAGEHRKRHASRAHKQEAVPVRLNPHYLGTMSAFGCIANFA